MSTQHAQSNRVPRKRSTAGFSLIELMVVIAIIAMLAAVVGYNVLGSLEDAEVTAAEMQIKNFRSALMSYRLTFKQFPSNEEGLEALVKNAKDRKFLDSNQIPLDPWGNPYVYTIEGSRNYKIVSYGADGIAGGEGDNADISSNSLADDDS